MKICKSAALAASISLALGSAAAMAAPQSTTRVPGQGAVVNGAPAPHVTLPSAGNGHTMTIQLGGNTVIDWGGAHGAINPRGVAGFNIGRRATVSFTHTGAGAFGVLNVDVSGNPSRLDGTLTGQGNVFVANRNGIIVGPHATITAGGALGLIANRLAPATFDGTPGSIAYDAAGGNVRIVRGATLDGSSVLVSGGRTVHVDIAAITAQGPASTPGGAAVPGTITLQASVASGTVVPGAPSRARLVVSGDNAGDVIFHSGGDAINRGTVALDARTTVAGTLLNTGTIELAPGFGTDSYGDLLVNALVNRHGNVSAHGVELGSLRNSGTFDGGAAPLLVVAGGVTNVGRVANVSVVAAYGDVVNRGTFEAHDDLNIFGGNLVNWGNLSVSNIFVTNGGITNNGHLTVTDADFEAIPIGRINQGAPFIVTSSDARRPGFREGADYSIVNNGVITNSFVIGWLLVDANDSRGLLTQVNAQGRAGPNGSTGSFINRGRLMLGAPGSYPRLYAYANNDIRLGGALQFTDGTSPVVGDPSTWLGAVFLRSGGPDGTVTVATPITSIEGVRFNGKRVAIHADVLAQLAVGILAGDGSPQAGHRGHLRASDYAVSVSPGVTVATVPGANGKVFIEGRSNPDFTFSRPNMWLRGTLSGDTVEFAGSNLYSGRHGRIVATGPNPAVLLNFTGSIGTAPYLERRNFRYNGLPIIDAGHDAAGRSVPVELWFSPAGYKSSPASHGGRSVNLLVDGSTQLIQNGIRAPVAAGGSAAVGASDWANIALIVQATGNISTLRAFYWPGYVYLGTIASSARGRPLSGTLGTGSISLGGDFNNVLPGNVAGASGMTFATRFPLMIASGAHVVTNANADVGFGTYRLTRGYATGALSPGTFFGGTRVDGVVHYDLLPPSRFRTEVPSSRPFGFGRAWPGWWWFHGSHGHASHAHRHITGG